MSCNGAVIFGIGIGKIIVIDEDIAPVNFAVDGNLQTFNDLKCIATSVGLQAQSGFQFMHALREFIYVYVFTERMGEIVINGLAFPEACHKLGPQDDVENDCVYGTSGLERLLSWYECNRITSRAEPINISFGPTISYDAFLVSLKADLATAETGIAQFSMRFNFVPNTSDDDDFCFDVSDTCLELPCGDIE